jgi:hypothetical protein
MIRYFGAVKVVTNDGSVVVERADGLGRVFLSAHEAEAAGALVVSDGLEFSVIPGGVGVDVLLRRARRGLSSTTRRSIHLGLAGSWPPDPSK